MRDMTLGALVAFALVTLSGCQQRDAPWSPRNLAEPETSGSSSANQPRDTLAYEHAVSVELDAETLPGRLRELEGVCKADGAGRCAILESALRWRESTPSATLRMRVAPDNVDRLITLASRGGKIVGRNTHAEDLAQPVADAERDLALLGVHRDRLADIMKRKDLPIEQLITVSKELATVHAQIDSLNSTHANLSRRIDTDLLTIDLSLPMSIVLSERTPVADALRASGETFREALAMVIGFLSGLVPWLFVVLPGLILLRMFWRWLGRRLGRWERQAA
jgi:hypothetical protein